MDEGARSPPIQGEFLGGSALDSKREDTPERVDWPVQHSY